MSTAKARQPESNQPKLPPNTQLQLQLPNRIKSAKITRIPGSGLNGTARRRPGGQRPGTDRLGPTRLESTRPSYIISLGRWDGSRMNFPTWINVLSNSFVGVKTCQNK